MHARTWAKKVCVDYGMVYNKDDDTVDFTESK